VNDIHVVHKTQYLVQFLANLFYLTGNQKIHYWVSVWHCLALLSWQNTVSPSVSIQFA
jgi:hypothetical protein